MSATLRCSWNSTKPSTTMNVTAPARTSTPSHFVARPPRSSPARLASITNRPGYRGSKTDVAENRGVAQRERFDVLVHGRPVGRGRSKVGDQIVG